MDELVHLTVAALTIVVAQAERQWLHVARYARAAKARGCQGIFFPAPFWFLFADSSACSLHIHISHHPLRSTVTHDAVEDLSANGAGTLAAAPGPLMLVVAGY
jgi:hypothetical protein